MIIRVVGQNGGGSRVYVHQINKALSQLGKQVTTFFKEYKIGDPITTVPPENCAYYFSINPVKILLFAIKNKKNIEYIHSHLRNATVICHIISKLIGIRHIITVHGPISYGKKSIKDKIIIRLFRTSLEQSTVSIFISEFTLQKTLQLCKLERKNNFRVVHNGSDKVIKSNTLSKSTNEFRIIVVGELTDRKRPLEIIELCRILHEDEEIKGRFHIDVYGDGYLKSHIANSVKAFKLENSITLHGNVYEIEKIYGNASIHLIFAYDEGFGRVITESMAHGVSTIAFNSGAFPEIIKHGSCGFLFDDTRDCAQQLKNIILRKTEIPSQDEILRIFSEKFSSSVFEANTIRVINEALV